MKQESPKTGLARALSKLGYCSRSQAAELIRAGRVKLNGKIRRDPETTVSQKSAEISVDGQSVADRQRIYLMMNKPRGVVTTAADEKGRETVYSVLRSASGAAVNRGPNHGLQAWQWVAPVGRLDKASEGLLLLTNDSQWAARITAPETHLEKIYHVQIANIGTEALFRRMQQGVRAGNDVLKAKRARLLRAGEKNCWLEIVLDEGKNRHIRRMMDGLGIEVLRLVRVAIGTLELGDLPKGMVRPLTRDEKRILDRTMTGRRP